VDQFILNVIHPTTYVIGLSNDRVVFRKCDSNALVQYAVDVLASRMYFIAGTA